MTYFGVILELNGIFFVGSRSFYNFPVVVLHTKTLIYFHSWCMNRGNVWISTKSNNLFLLIEGQTHCSTPWCVGMRLTVIEPIKNVFFDKTSTLPPRIHQNLLNSEGVCMQNNRFSTPKSCWVVGSRDTEKAEVFRATKL